MLSEQWKSNCVGKEEPSATPESFLPTPFSEHLYHTARHMSDPPHPTGIKNTAKKAKEKKFSSLNRNKGKSNLLLLLRRRRANVLLVVLLALVLEFSSLRTMSNSDGCLQAKLPTEYEPNLLTSSQVRVTHKAATLLCRGEESTSRKRLSLTAGLRYLLRPVETKHSESSPSSPHNPTDAEKVHTNDSGLKTKNHISRSFSTKEEQEKRSETGRSTTTATVAGEPPSMSEGQNIKSESDENEHSGVKELAQSTFLEHSRTSSNAADIQHEEGDADLASMPECWNVDEEGMRNREEEEEKEEEEGEEALNELESGRISLSSMAVAVALGESDHILGKHSTSTPIAQPKKPTLLHSKKRKAGDARNGSHVRLLIRSTLYTLVVKGKQSSKREQRAERAKSALSF